MTASVILPGAVVGERATIADSIVAGHIGAGAAVAGSVIGAGYRVPDDATVVDRILPSPDDT